MRRLLLVALAIAALATSAGSCDKPHGGPGDPDCVNEKGSHVSCPDDWNRNG